MIIETRNLNKKFGNFQALKNLNLNIEEGDIYGLVGPNGAGKSTLLKILAGHINKSDGTLKIFEKESQEDLNKARSQMGFLIENAAFYDYMTGKQNLIYIAKLKGLDPKNEDIWDLCKTFKIDDSLNKKVKSYSTGMKQRLGMVAATMNRPKILVLDEPINGLDPQGIVELRNFIKKINLEWSTSIIISSHILSELSVVANKFAFIKKGELIEEISLEKLHEKSKRYYELEFEDPDLKKALPILEENKFIEDHKVKNDSFVEVYNEVDIKKLQELLGKNGIFLKSYKKNEGNLEDYYVNLMEEK